MATSFGHNGHHKAHSPYNTPHSPNRGSGEFSQYSDSLRAGRSADRILVEKRFSAPVKTDPGDHPAYYAMGTGSLPKINRPGRGVGHPPHLPPRLKKE